MGEPLLPPAPEPAAPRPAAPRPPWGALDVALGLFGGIAAMVGAGLLVAAVASAVGLPTSGVVCRYLLVFVGDAVLLGAPLGVAVALGAATARNFGFARPRPRGLLLAVVVGLGLDALTLLYGAALELAVPAVAERATAEETRQMAALDGPWPLLFVAAVALAPLAEEVFFRAFVFAGLAGRLRPTLAAAISAALFAASHGMPASAPPLFAVGYACAALYRRERNIWAPIACHAAFNAAALVLRAVS